MSIRDNGRRFKNSVRRSYGIASLRIRRIIRNLRQKKKRINGRLLQVPAVLLVVRTFKELGVDDASHLAAGVAYYSLLSLFPLILGLIALLGLFLPAESIHNAISDFVKENFPGSVDFVESNIQQVIDQRGTLGLLSLFLLLWSGSAMFGAVSRAINRAWDITFEQDLPFYKRKPRDFAMALGVGLLLILSIGITMVFTILSDTDVSWMSIAISVGAGLFAFLLNIIIFLLLYKYIPNIKTNWRDIWPGAVLAGVLFEITKYTFTLYLSRFVNYELVYGSVGSVITLLVWVYICAFILILGAEFSSEYSRMRQEGIRIISKRALFRKQKDV